MPLRYLLIQFLGEFGCGPKEVYSMYDDSKHRYYFNRYSIGHIVNGYLPVGKTKKHSLFLGGGVFYHFLELDGYDADTFGGRVQIGYRADYRHVSVELILGYDHARGKTNGYNPYLGRNMILDFSSFLIGINLYFKII